MTSLLPYVKIAFQNGALGITEPTADGICGLVPDGAVVVNAYTENNGAAYLITSLSCVTKTGTDALTYEMIREFFEEAGEGSYLWLLNAKPSSSAAGVTNLQNLSNGACRTIGVVTPIASADLDTEVDALNDAAEELVTSIYAPVLVIAGTPAPGTIGSAEDLTQLASNRVAVVCGNEVTGDATTDALLDDAGAVGLLLGRIAHNAVQTSVARVSDGAIKARDMALGTAAITNANAQTLHGKGYITPRTWTGKAGFYWSSDALATAVTDDYGMIPRRRTIDKAFRIAYKTLIEEVGMEIPVSSTGGIPTGTAKAIEAMVETAIEQGMTNQGNLGTDPDDDTDKGVIASVDPNQNVVTTNKIEVSLKVKPYGYAYYIDVNLSFYTTV